MSLILRKKEGDIMVVGHIKMCFDGLEDFAVIRRVQRTVTFRKDVIVLVGTCNEDNTWCNRIECCRISREGVAVQRSQFWARLRFACKEAVLEQVHCVGGFCPPVYKDEIAVRDHSRQGSYGWIIKKKNIRDLLSRFAPQSVEKKSSLKKKLDEKIKELDGIYHPSLEATKEAMIQNWVLETPWRHEKEETTIDGVTTIYCSGDDSLSGSWACRLRDREKAFVNISVKFWEKREDAEPIKEFSCSYEEGEQLWLSYNKPEIKRLKKEIRNLQAGLRNP